MNKPFKNAVSACKTKPDTHKPFINVNLAIFN